MRIGKKNNALLKTLAYYKHSLKSPTKWKTWQEIWNLECQEYMDSFKKKLHKNYLASEGTQNIR